MTATRATVNQSVQLGVEVTSGTAVAAGLILPGTSIEPSPKFNAKSFRSQGRKYGNLTVPGKEWTEAKLTGLLSYTEMSYWMSSAINTVTPVTHAAGTLSKDWTFTPSLSAPVTPVTFTVEHGDSTRADKFAYGLVTDYDIKFSRDEIDFSGSLLGQSITDGITMTGSPTKVAEVPVLPIHVNHYIDNAAGSIGSTQLLDVIEADFSVGGIYGSYWPMSRSNASFAQHVEQAPKAAFKLTLQADSAGMGPLTNARLGSSFFYRVDCVGPIVEGSIHYALQLDMAIKVTGITFVDKAGVYCVEITFDVVEDDTLAKAYSILLTNKLASL